MNQKIKSFIVGLFLFVAQPALSMTFSNNSSINIGSSKVVCEQSRAFVEVQVLINADDKGKPGVIYAGLSDTNQTIGYLFDGNSWVKWGGGLFSPYLIGRAGLVDTVIRVPVANIEDFPNTQFYIGYGTLLPGDEDKIQRYIQGYNTIKAKYPDRNIPFVDPDQQRLAFVQKNMTDLFKYHYIMDWTYQTFTMCIPQT